MSDAVAGAVVGGMLGAVVIGIIVFYVLVVVAYWKIFKKAGEPGWKSIIPIYNEYILFKISWKTTMFWVALVLMIVGSIIAGFDAAQVTTYSSSYASVAVTEHGFIYYLGSLCSFAGAVIIMICWYFLGKSFGHGVPFFIASLFFPNITTLYLGFNSDEYLGNTTEQ